MRSFIHSCFFRLSFIVLLFFISGSNFSHALEELLRFESILRIIFIIRQFAIFLLQSLLFIQFLLNFSNIKSITFLSYTLISILLFLFDFFFVQMSSYLSLSLHSLFPSFFFCEFIFVFHCISMDCEDFMRRFCLTLADTNWNSFFHLKCRNILCSYFNLLCHCLRNIVDITQLIEVSHKTVEDLFNILFHFSIRPS